MLIPYSYPTAVCTNSHSAAFCFQAGNPWMRCGPIRGFISLRDDTHIYCLAVPTFGQGHVCPVFSRILVGALFWKFLFSSICFRVTTVSDTVCGSDDVVTNCVASWRIARSALGCLGTTSRVWVSGHFTPRVPFPHLWICCQTLLAPFDNTIHSYLPSRS